MADQKKELNFYEDFTKLHWVKWTTRQPDWNGTVYVRWNGKYTSNGLVWNGYLIKLDGDETRTKYTASKKTGKITVKYTANQKRILEDMYWLEEIHDFDGYTAYEETLIPEEFKAKINVPEQFKESES